MSVVVKVNGDYARTLKFLKNVNDGIETSGFDEWGKAGVDALKDATPVDSGLTKESWSYKIIRRKDSITIEWNNSNIVDGVPIALIIQYGHATKNGGYIKGIDYINPALQPLFDKIAEEVWKEVSKK